MARTHDLFAAGAVRAAGYRWFSPVSVVVPPSALYAAALSILAMAGLLMACVVIEVPERVRAYGVLMPSKGLLKVRAPRSGWVQGLSVSDGAAVVKGQSLLWVTDMQSAPGREPEGHLRLKSLRKELQLTQLSIEEEIAGIDARRVEKTRRSALVRDQLSAAQSELRARWSQEVLQGKRAERAAALATNGLISSQKVDDANNDALQSKATSQLALQRVLGLQRELALLEQQIDDDARLPWLLRTRSRIRVEEIQREIAATELRSTAVVIAKGVGIATGLSVRAGSFVEAGQLLMTVQNPDDRLEARLFIDADNAAMIKVGQQVELQLRAYPHQLFGTQTAEITSISAAALSARDMGAPAVLQGSVFELRARLNSVLISARGDIWPLPPGTVFTANLVRRRWPLYQWLMHRSVRDA